MRDETYWFSLEIVKLYKFLIKNFNEYTITKQIVRSWTSIWANVREAQSWQSKKDFIAKLSISLKEAHETEYRFMILRDSKYLAGFPREGELWDQLQRIIATLTKIIKSSKTVNGLPSTYVGVNGQR